MKAAAKSVVSRSRGERGVALFLLVLAVFLMSCAGTPHGRSKDEWAKARDVAEQYLRTKYGTAWRITEERSGVPFMFSIDVADAASVLVHDGAVFEQRGIAGLDRYLRGSRCVEQRLPTRDDMVVLLHFFDAFPPDPKPQGYFRKSDPNEAVRPRLDYLDDGRATLTLYYRMPDEPSDHEGDGEDDELVLRQWTLTMNPGQMPVWTSETRLWDKATKRFRVDHTN